MKQAGADGVELIFSRTLSRASFPGLAEVELDALLDQSLILPTATTLTAGQQILLMLNSIEIIGDEAHGLASRPLRLGFTSIALRAMSSAATLSGALNVLSRYFDTSASPFALRVSSSAGITEVAFRAEGRDDPRGVQLEQIWFHTIYGALSWFVGRRIPITAPTMVRVGDPAAKRRHASSIAPSVPGEISAFRMPNSCLGWKRKVQDVEEPLWEALRFWIYGVRPEEERAPLDVMGDPAAVVGMELPGLESVGERQRSRLLRQRYGTSIRELRGDAIVAQASHLLRTSTLSVDEIAGQMGYSEERSFRRFLRQRTGQTPAEIRRQHVLARAQEQAAIDARIHAVTRKMDC